MFGVRWAPLSELAEFSPRIVDPAPTLAREMRTKHDDERWQKRIRKRRKRIAKQNSDPDLPRFSRFYRQGKLFSLDWEQAALQYVNPPSLPLDPTFAPYSCNGESPFRSYHELFDKTPTSGSPDASFSERAVSVPNNDASTSMDASSSDVSSLFSRAFSEDGIKPARLRF